MSNHNSQKLRDAVTEARRRGKCAYHEGDDLTASPYPLGPETEAWRAGWLFACKEDAASMKMKEA